MNVSGWRAEPEQAISEHTARLLRWMTTVPAPAAASMEEVADRIATGLSLLLDAGGVSLWVRHASDDELSCAANGGEGSGAAFVGSGEAQEPVKVTNDAFPGTPLWLEEATPEIAALPLRLATLAGFHPDQPPSLAVTLAAPAGGGTQKAQGLALLWLDTPDGLLSEAVQPILQAAAQQAGQMLAGAARAERLARSLRQLGEAFSSAIDFRDSRRAGHSNAVSYYAGIMARAFELDEGQVERIEFAALVHDLGRVSVPDAILQKTSPLTPEELAVVRRSPAVGAKWLEQVDGMEEVALIVRHQSENFDGSGSPDGLAGDAIPLGSRIVAVATRFTAMTTPRADRAALSVVGGALENLVEQNGTVLDPAVVEVFLRVMGRSL